MRRPGERAWWPYAFIAPALIVYVIFILLPIFTTLLVSFTSWDGLTAPVPNGIDNYTTAFNDPLFIQTIGNNIAFAIWFCVLPIALGLVITSLVARSGLPGSAFFRAAAFLPYVLSLVVVGVVWGWIYSPTYGPLSQFLTGIGVANPPPWLGDFTLALPSVGVVGTWVEYGFVTVLMVAGVQKIPEELYEAARLDGANPWAQFRNVTLPGLRNEITVALVFTLIASFRVFDLIFVLTKGGPGTNTYTMSFGIYKSAFQYNAIGYAAAMAVILTLVILAISVFVVRYRERGGAEA